jgi:hypothetical protein
VLVITDLVGPAGVADQRDEQADAEHGAELAEAGVDRGTETEAGGMSASSMP